MRCYAIIVAGGSGTRFKSEIPKQFLLLNGKPVLMHTIEKFINSSFHPEIIVALPSVHIRTWKELCEKFVFQLQHVIVPGGETRFGSVKNCLNIIREKSIVAVHDGVRPLASTALIDRCFETADEHNAAMPVIPIHESVRKIEDDFSVPVSRSSYCIVQTPQCFHSELLKKAYDRDYDEVFTDDSTVVELTGTKIKLIEGEMANIKITTPGDLKIAEVLANES
jgi:2-C-methyl-D-erythritol 4-phosphate cytidylyltransferase